jgi:hypothetical protein
VSDVIGSTNPGPALVQQTERLNEAIARAEKALLGLSGGLAVSVVLTPTEKPANKALAAFKASQQVRLWFRKSGKNWRLVLTGGSFNPPVPISQASRAYRVKAVARFPELERVLRAAAKKEARDVELAANTLETWLSGLGLEED